MSIQSRFKKILWLAGSLILTVPFGFVETPAFAAVSAESHDSAAHKGSLSFNFQSIDIKELLQLIAKNANLNFIISDSVKGMITINLTNVTWQEALNIVLESHGLSQRRMGNVLMISTLEEMTANQTKQLQSNQAIENLVPLSSKIIHLKYTNATDLATLLKGSQNSMLTSRGQVAVDTRTNSVIVRDVASNLQEVAAAIKQLDVPAKQVLIEARIVTIDKTYESQLGASFGLTKTSHLTGTLEGANSLAQGTSPALITNVSGTQDYTRRLNFNIPATQLNVDSANPATIGLALAKIGSFYLDMELSALEGEGHSEIIATPRVITSNQQKATIATGEEIPYSESTSSGATSIAFKKAELSLEITPQITPDNKIVLSLKATEDSRGTQTVLQAATSTTAPVLGPPSINTQEVESNVLLNNNETVVIGGIYKITKSDTVERVPFLGSIPFVGALFRHTGQSDEKTELLIFITPRIITNSANMKVPSKGEV